MMYTAIMILGILAWLTILFSFLTGSRILKVKFRIHKRLGILALSLATIHGLYMLYYNIF